MMSLLDKFKNLFTDEEVEEIEEEIPIKKKEENNTLPTFMREKNRTRRKTSNKAS